MQSRQNVHSPCHSPVRDAEAGLTESSQRPARDVVGVFVATTSPGVTILGIPLCHGDCVMASLSTICKSHPSLLERIQLVTDLHSVRVACGFVVCCNQSLVLFASGQLGWTQDFAEEPRRVGVGLFVQPARRRS